MGKGKEKESATETLEEGGLLPFFPLLSLSLIDVLPPPIPLFVICPSLCCGHLFLEGMSLFFFFVCFTLNKAHIPRFASSFRFFGCFPIPFLFFVFRVRLNLRSPLALLLHLPAASVLVPAGLVRFRADGFSVGERKKGKGEGSPSKRMGMYFEVETVSLSHTL